MVDAVTALLYNISSEADMPMPVARDFMATLPEVAEELNETRVILDALRDVENGKRTPEDFVVSADVFLYGPQHEAPMAVDRGEPIEYDPELDAARMMFGVDDGRSSGG